MNDTTTWTTTIAKSPDEVWAVVGDVERHSEWSPTAFKAKKASDGPVGVGTVYESRGWLPGKGKEHRNDVTITAFEPGKRIAFDAKDAEAPTTSSDWVLTPEGSGTRVDRTMVFPKPPGFSGAMWPVFFPMLVKPAIQKNLNRLKTLVETGSPDSK